MQQLKRSYSLTDLGEQQFDQHRFTDVTEEEEGERFSSIFFYIFSSPVSSSDALYMVASNSQKVVTSPPV